MAEQKITPYQFKLDLGEGPRCHKAYEEYLQHYELEDNPERWVFFVQMWTDLETLEALVESAGSTLQ